MSLRAGAFSRSLSTPTVALCALLGLAIALRLAVIQTGSPFITIDDKTAFEGGFLVWFGHAPPQRMYLESWLYGVVSIAVYCCRTLVGGGALSFNLVADAYRDFYNHPDSYAWIWRAFTLLLDLFSALLVYGIAKRVLQQRWRGWAAALVPALYLLSYNTIWSGIVARPDSVLSFLCTLALWLYLKSNWGRRYWWFLGCAVTLGLAAGMKLHGAFLAVFICVDLLRVYGVAAAARKCLPLALVTIFFLLWAAGSPFFDPLTYIKLRFSNYADDLSAWLGWREHFAILLRGTGWLTIPLMIQAGCLLVRAAGREVDDAIKSVLVIAVGWLLLFAIIRQLRGYWMLPALPIFYLVTVYGLTLLRNARVAAAGAAVMATVLLAQTVHEMRELRSAPYDQLRTWLAANVRGQPFYVFGYDALMLPKNTACIAKTTQALERRIAADRQQSLPFTVRHLKNWEEATALTLFDMLDFRNDSDFEFYDFYSTPPATLAGIISTEQMEYLLLQDGFDLDREPHARELLQSRFELVAQAYGAGGSGDGLKYRIYRRQ